MLLKSGHFLNIQRYVCNLRYMLFRIVLRNVMLIIRDSDVLILVSHIVMSILTINLLLI